MSQRQVERLRRRLAAKQFGFKQVSRVLRHVDSAMQDLARHVENVDHPTMGALLDLVSAGYELDRWVKVLGEDLRRMRAELAAVDQ